MGGRHGQETALLRQPTPLGKGDRRGSALRGMQRLQRNRLGPLPDVAGVASQRWTGWNSRWLRIRDWRGHAGWGRRRIVVQRESGGRDGQETPCYLNRHHWVRQETAEGRPYVACRDCHTTDWDYFDRAHQVPGPPWAGSGPRS